ncbi:TPA: DNA-binding protein [Escherichia coli]|nr:DNA-binding protein [Escherichia coli]
MKKLTFEIRSPAHQQNAIHAVQQILPDPTKPIVVTIQERNRSLDQNRKLWACLGDVSRQVEWHGRWLDAESWKCVFKRHDNVKRTIETLAKNGVIRLPQIEVSERINNLGFNVQYEHYVFEGEQGKRDSIVVVAQLSPEFTARLVDRWRELEETAVNIPKTLPEALRLAADLAEQKMQLENQLAIAAPKVEFADRVGEASGILIGNFAKVVGIGQNKLFAWMRDHKILIASGSRRNVPMQEYMDRGYFTVKETAVNTNHGIQISFTTKITGRGQQWLTRKLLDNGMLKVTGEAA